MYDLIYLSNEADRTRARTEAEQRFPKARIEDASDFIHSDRFSIEIDMPAEEYCLEILDLGLALHSLHFGLLMMEKPAQAKDLVEKWKIKTKEESDND